ncbi:membrane fusion-like protein [Shewanella sp. SG41-4]|uniref:membrane fusion-like protein n=1 Tax=Shewanella sp. SG41-4 TaxID=2760976 RepID=UPI001603F7AD|nr:membrane fusion-like protein [Shewanella sp. SG41-4]MBB1440315.1 membrane fusion-like protein [Shewanella sp. SG41-4]
MMVKYGVGLSYLIASIFSLAQAESIDIKSLGNIQLSYAQPQKVASYEGSALPAQISMLPGSEYWVSTPENIQQVSFLVTQGQMVSKGQAIVRLTGPEVFHYLAQVEAASNLYQLANTRYERNKSLFKNGSISADKWREISQDYFDSYLEYEHMHHFMEIVLSTDAATDSFVVGTPMSGIVKFNLPNGPYMAGSQIFSLVPSDSVRVKVNVPMSQSLSLSAVNINQCHIAIDSISAIADGAFVTAWSLPVPKECNLLLGQQLTVIPEYQKSVYMLPKNSVFSWEQDSQILTKTGETLTSLTIDILGSTPEQYIVASDQDLSKIEVLTESVAAVKGILLGLGGE